MISKKSQIYAQALFELKPEKETLQLLKQLSDLLTSEDILGFFLSFVVPKEDKKKLLEKVLKLCPPLLKNFFYVLLDNRAFALLPQIVLAYQNLIEDKEGLCSGIIYSPSPISAEQKQKIEKHLKTFFNKRVDLKQKEDKSLIGGLSIQAGGFIFDSTVKQQLKQFKRKGA